MAQEKEQKPAFTPENIASTEHISDVKLSPDAKQLLYHVKPLYKSGEHATCAIWLAEVGRADSARQFTSGLHNDYAARFHPDGRKIVFLSDRHKAGGPAQIYAIDVQGGEAYPLFGKENKRGISGFEISPDGRYVGFTSPDEPTPEDERREKEKDDAQVFGDKRTFHHLRLYSFASGDAREVEISQGNHVERFLWAHDSKSVLVLTREGSPLEFTESEIKVMRISLSSGAIPEMVGSYPHSPTGIVLLSTGEIIDIQSYNPSRMIDSKSVFIHSSDDFNKAERLAYGKDDDAVRIVHLSGTNHLAVEVAQKLNTTIEIFFRGPNNHYTSTPLEFTDDAVEMESWDVQKSGETDVVLAVIKSSSVRRESSNVWTISIAGENFAQDACKVSSHLKWMTQGPPIHTEPVSWAAKDGTELDGIMTFPVGHQPGESFQPYPTIMFIHGGPYWRATCDLSPLFLFANWHFPLSEQGYLVIVPNYRGGQGHGSEYARAARARAGNLDWSDCESMLDTLIERGYVDPNRLGICGWSYGGFMTAWGVGMTKNRFKAGVMGAGISDWGMMAATNDLPDLCADIGGCAPWDTADPKLRTDILRSPVGHVSGIETAMLVMHGEKDDRVPVSQGVAFFRGLRRRSKYPERHQLIIYPREPHIFTEKSHVRDVVKRVIDHFNTWM